MTERGSLESLVQKAITDGRPCKIKVKTQAEATRGRGLVQNFAPSHADHSGIVFEVLDLGAEVATSVASDSNLFEDVIDVGGDILEGAAEIGGAILEFIGDAASG